MRDRRALRPLLILAGLCMGGRHEAVADDARQVFTLQCAPDAPDTAADPIVAITINLSNAILDADHHRDAADVVSYVHVSRAGKRYERETQYDIKDIVTDGEAVTWRGRLAHSNALSMAATIDHVYSPSPHYTETIDVAGDARGPRVVTSATCHPTIAPHRPREAGDRRAAAAAPTSATNACIGVEDDAQRLACYDKAAGRPPRPSASKPAPAEQQDEAKALSAMTDLTPANLPAMHEAFRQNETRFMRDYEGRRFSGRMKIHGVSQDALDKSIVLVSFGDSAAEVMCRSSEPAFVTAAAKLNLGDEAVVAGAIDDYAFGAVYLKSCSIAGR